MPDSGYTPGDDSWTLLLNMYSYFSGKMTQEGIDQFRLARDIQNEAADCKRCEDQRDYLLQYSKTSLLPLPVTAPNYLKTKKDLLPQGPVIRFLSDNIRQLGGDLHSHNIYCRRCPTRRYGGFDHTLGILICANEVKDQGRLEDTMAHEMVHAYDHLRFNVDWRDNLRHAACSEVIFSPVAPMVPCLGIRPSWANYLQIRASSLSGECRWAREFFQRSQWKLTQQHQACVRRRAVLSVMARPNCKDEPHAQQVVNEVWDSCFKDTRPFDEIYR